MASAAETGFDTEDGIDACDDLAPGTQLLHGQYTIVDFLNAGGFGITYRAVDSLERPVVIKECFPGAFCRRSRVIVQPRSRAHKSEFEGIVRLFVQEARSLSKLQHPNIVGVHQVFEENDTAYMALDFVEGRDLLEIMEDPETDLPPAQIVSILRNMLDAVGFVHAQDMLHRDISPDNILVDGTGKPVLIDFGAARQQAQKQSRVLSAMRVVKDGYSPQEFYITGSDQGPFSDLYALGASFYHLIAGHIPPDSQRRLTAIATSDEDPYEPLEGRFPDYDDRVLASIDRALAILPKDRMQSAQEWLAHMDGKDAPVAAAAQAKAPKAKPTSPSAAAAPKAKGKGGLVAGVAAIAIAAAAGFVVTQTDLLSGMTSDTEGTDIASDQPAPTSPAPAVPVEIAEEVAPSPGPAEALVDEAEVADTAFSTTTVDPIEPEASTETDAPIIVAPEVALAREPDPAPAPAPEVEAPAELPAVADAPADAPAEDPLVEAPAETPEVAEAPVLDLPLVLPTQRPAPAPQDTPLSPADPSAEITVASVEPRLVPTDPTWSAVTTPDSVTPMPGWQDAPVISAQRPGTELAPASALAGGWSVALPFEDLRLDEGGASYIVAINGTPVANRSQFNSAVAQAFDLTSVGSVSVDLGIGLPGQSPETVQETTLPVAHYVAVPSGPTFATIRDGDTWVTRVVEIAEGADTNLKVGDQVFASVDIGTRFNQPTDLRTLLEKELETDRQSFAFAVLRDGANWVASMARPEID